MRIELVWRNIWNSLLRIYHIRGQVIGHIGMQFCVRQDVAGEVFDSQHFASSMATPLAQAGKEETLNR